VFEIYYSNKTKRYCSNRVSQSALATLDWLAFRSDVAKTMKALFDDQGHLDATDIQIDEFLEAMGPYRYLMPMCEIHGEINEIVWILLFR